MRDRRLRFSSHRVREAPSGSERRNPGLTWLAENRCRQSSARVKRNVKALPRAPPLAEARDSGTGFTPADGMAPVGEA
jgi:hypothetical protein